MPFEPTMERIGGRARAEWELAQYRSGYWRSRATLAAIARRDRPVVVGPFLSEVGFECLYWIPLLRWLADTQGVEPGRVTAFSRGGTAAWYEGIADTYVDVFDHLSSGELKARQEARVSRTRNEKQLTAGSDEAELLSRAGLSVGTDVIDPSLMYRLFWSVWSLRRPVGRVLDHVHFAPFGAHLPPPPESLPDSYVAVKPYFSSCFPDTQANRDFLAELIGRLSESTEVVLLATGIDVDGHEDFVTESPSISGISSFLEPRNNLEVQSAVVRNASALYTTYGGFAHLGPFLGTATFAFHSEENFNFVHLDVMRRAVATLRRHGQGGFVLLDVRDVDLARLDRGDERHACPR